jgi:hypothetical protein
LNKFIVSKSIEFMGNNIQQLHFVFILVLWLYSTNANETTTEGNKSDFYFLKLRMNFKVSFDQKVLRFIISF